jgi:hypothetical protein
MQVLFPLPWLVQGMLAGVVTLAVLTVRAAIEGRAGVAFDDLWTALAVGTVVGFVPYAIAKAMWWRMRRSHGADLGKRSYGTSFERPGRQGAQPRRLGRASGGLDRFDTFTDRSRRVLTYAQDESQRFNHNYIGTEHLLLGLVREGEGVAARVLENMNVELPKVRTAVEFIMGRGDRPVVGEVGLTPRAKRVIELAIDEARRLGHNYIGTEHILIGLVREGEGIAAGVLESLDVRLDRVRHEVIRVISRTTDSA